MLQEDYQVSIDTFKGPLDLLLFLIRRAEVEITDIPITTITDQYLDFLHGIDLIDIDVAGEFLVMAATLVEIKARVLAAQRQKKAAQDAGGGEEAAPLLNLDEDDPRYELVQQLLAYQRYRVAAEELDQLRDSFSRRFPRRPGAFDALATPGPADADGLDIEDAHVFDLFQAYERIIESVDFSRLGEHQVQDADTPIGLHQDDLVDRLMRAECGRITLQEAWIGRTRADVIGLFLATLELVRQRRITVVQDRIHGEIMLQLNADPQEQPAPAGTNDVTEQSKK
jgi:segregation and condensation protein A